MINKAASAPKGVDPNTGFNYPQLISKFAMGAVFYNQACTNYLGDKKLSTASKPNDAPYKKGAKYTGKEHVWDEAFGYWNPPLDFSSNWPDERASEDRFWSHYSNTVDPLLGTNDLIMNAFREGRTAIVNNDLEGKNTQRVVLYEKLELVAAAVAEVVAEIVAELSGGDGDRA